MERAPVTLPATLTLTWRADEYGRPERALYLGKIYTGELMAGYEHHHPGEFRAWIQVSEGGESLGWFATEAEARAALEDAVVRGITDGGDV